MAQWWATGVRTSTPVGVKGSSKGNKTLADGQTPHSRLNYSDITMKCGIKDFGECYIYVFNVITSTDTLMLQKCNDRTFFKTALVCVQCILLYLAMKQALQLFTLYCIEIQKSDPFRKLCQSAQGGRLTRFSLSMRFCSRSLLRPLWEILVNGVFMLT